VVPILLALNGVIWYGVTKAYKYDRANGPYPENPQFDLDLDKLWEEGLKSNFIPSSYPVINTVSQLEEEKDDRLIMQDFEAWQEQERNRDKDLEDYLWYEGILNPDEVIWCDGTPLEPYNEADYEKFLKIKDKAFLEGIYNSKPLAEGGEEDLYKAWFMLKGCSDYGAEKLLETGIMPWQFDLEG